MIVLFTMDSKIQETLDILQEECGELIVEVSKCRRFGLDSLHYKTGIAHSQMLEAEAADVLAMIDILVEREIFNRDNLKNLIKAKKDKLKQWSKIYE